MTAAKRIGGATGWYYPNWLWTLRGWLDLLMGGVGMRRGRRDPDRLRVGDTLDCRRVESIEPGRRLRLFAEMKLPGRAWLEFEVRPDGDGARLVQTATFDPMGLWGLAYWYAVWPLHQLVFAGMLKTGFDAPNYQLDFATKRGEWLEHRLAFKDFVPTFSGRTLTGVPPLSPSKTSSVGLLISDKKDGPFRLEIQWIKAAPSPR